MNTTHVIAMIQREIDRARVPSMDMSLDAFQIHAHYLATLYDKIEAISQLPEEAPWPDNTTQPLVIYGHVLAMVHDVVIAIAGDSLSHMANICCYIGSVNKEGPALSRYGMSCSEYSRIHYGDKKPGEILTAHCKCGITCHRDRIWVITEATGQTCPKCKGGSHE